MSNKKTLRDDFAVAIANAYINHTIRIYMHNNENHISLPPSRDIAQFSYSVADAMIAERNK